MIFTRVYLKYGKAGRVNTPGFMLPKEKCTYRRLCETAKALTIDPFSGMFSLTQKPQVQAIA